jgi:polyvinyl alcohol dehydrogenase (cytochrome)
MIVTSTCVIFSRTQSVQAASGDWPTYLENAQRSGYNSAETVINATSATNLKMLWKYQAGGYIYLNYISAQPIAAHGMIYWGSWDGNEHATSKSGTQVWQTGLGYTYSAQCDDLVGVASTATIATVTMSGISTPVIYVGGGNANFYALNANTGAIIWQTPLGTSPASFIWSSPVYYKGSIYIGLSSLGDCPLVQGKLFRLNASTGAIQNTFNVVPSGCTGGSVWGSPTIDASDGSVYFATGNNGACSSSEPYATALVKVKASNLSYIDSWQVPLSQQVDDSDFGATPTLFSAVMGGVTRSLVGVVNKNGMYYAFDRTAISHGPVWSAQIATVGGGCGPDCGDGSISSSAWDGSTLYIAGGQTTVGGTSCKGSLRAVNPANGTFLWEHCMAQGPVLGAVTMVPGVAVVGEGNTFLAVAASDGHTLYTFTDANSNSHFYGPATISKGVLYIGDFDGLMYAFGS